MSVVTNLGHMFSQDQGGVDTSQSRVSRFEILERLKASRSGYKGHVTRIRGEIEALMLIKKFEAVRDKLNNLEAAFSNLGRAHDAFLRCLDDPGERFQATMWFDDERDAHNGFVQRVWEWLDGSQRSQTLPPVNPSDSGSQVTVSKISPSSVSKASTRLSVKIKEAKAEEALAELRLQQLRRRFELQQRREDVMREEELLEVKSTIEQARLRVRILEEGEQSEERSFQRIHDSPSAAVLQSELSSVTKVPLPTRDETSTSRARPDLSSDTRNDPYTLHVPRTRSDLSSNARDETYTLHARSDPDPVCRSDNDTLRTRHRFDYTTNEWNREPIRSELDVGSDRGHPRYYGNLEQLLHQQQQMIGLNSKLSSRWRRQ